MTAPDDPARPEAPQPDAGPAPQDAGAQTSRDTASDEAAPDAPASESAPSPRRSRVPPPPGGGKASRKNAKAGKKDKEKDKGGIWKNWVRPILVVVTVVAVVRSSLIDWNDVPTGSMKPAIVEGDRIFVNKLAFGFKPPFSHGIPVPFTTTLDDPDGLHINLWGGGRDAYWFDWGQPERGDVVTFWSPIDGIRLVKRVVGAPNDTLEMRNCLLYLNGEAAQWTPLGQDPEDARFSLFNENIAGHSRIIRLVWNDAVEVPLPGAAPAVSLLGQANPSGADAPGPRTRRFAITEGVLSVDGQVVEPATFVQAAALAEQALLASVGGQAQGLTPAQYEALKDLKIGMVTHVQLSTFGPVTLGEDQFWMMGDNRDQSKDARSWAREAGDWKAGAIDRRAIAGHAGRIAWSLDKENYYLPRFGRTFKKLD
ncbi:MAG: signal peptidase I [Planctomycetota bacterium]